MAITIHLFGFEEGEVTVAHCGRRGIGLSTTKHLPIVTCRECKRRPEGDRRPTIRRPAPAAPTKPDKPEPSTTDSPPPRRRKAPAKASR